MSVYAGSFTANLVISSWLLWLICSSFGQYQLVIPTPGKCSAMVCVPWGQTWSWWYGYRSWPEALPNGTFPEPAAVENDTEPQHILFPHLQICLGDPYLFPPRIYLHLSELLQSKSIYWKLIYFNILEKVKRHSRANWNVTWGRVFVPGWNSEGLWKVVGDGIELVGGR